jgi:hypothetical protein
MLPHQRWSRRGLPFSRERDPPNGRTWDRQHARGGPSTDRTASCSGDMSREMSAPAPILRLLSTVSSLFVRTGGPEERAGGSV